MVCVVSPELESVTQKDSFVGSLDRSMVGFWICLRSDEWDEGNAAVKVFLSWQLQSGRETFPFVL